MLVQSHINTFDSPSTFIPTEPQTMEFDTMSPLEFPHIQPPKPSEKRTFALRDATIEDAKDIAELGGSIFSATFGFSIPSADLKDYLEEAYTQSAIEDDITSSTKHVFVAYSPEGRIVGFAQLTEGTTEPCISHIENQVELQRLYVHNEYHGSGVGKTLTNKVEELARKLGYTTIWLGVWEGNFIAQKVYERMGYSRAGDHEFKMGRCIQTDWIMCKDL